VAVVKGTYVLILALERTIEVRVGALGIQRFLPGYYAYAGSALGGLVPRLRRHLQGGARTHWHVDYLRQYADVAEVWYLASGERRECSWLGALSKLPSGRLGVPGFGSSDCKCAAHLVYFAAPPQFEQFRRALGAGGMGLQRLTPGSEGWGRLLVGGYSLSEKKAATASPTVSS
jgi:Uri superfamily endonuclease